jgi:sugar-specific transcriptional regulator TrmB
MNYIEELKELNLDENEIKVYLSNLTLGKAKSDEIAKHCGLIRTTTYSILQKLKQKGFISNILIDNINVFEALDPEKLLELLEEKKQKIESILPKLKELQLTKQENYGITFFEGKNGIKSVYNDIISTPNSKIKSIGSVNQFMNASGFFAKEYFRKKRERNIWADSISFDSKENRTQLELDKNHLRKTKFIPNIQLGSACFLYEDKVALLTTEAGNQKGFIIQDKEIKKLMEYMFDALNREARE